MSKFLQATAVSYFTHHQVPASQPELLMNQSRSLSAILSVSIIVATSFWLATRQTPASAPPAPVLDSKELGSHSVKETKLKPESLPSVENRLKQPINGPCSPQPATQDIAALLRDAITRNEEAEIMRLIQMLSENRNVHISSIIALAEDESIALHLRATVLRIMGNMSDDASLHCLVALSKSLRKHELRVEVIKSLGRRPEHGAELRLQELSADPSDPAQNMAVSFLGKGADQHSKNILKRHLQSHSNSEELKNASIYALRHYKDEQTRTMLIGVASDATAASRLRATAIYSLGVIGNHDALSAIKNNLNSPEREVRYSAVLASSRVHDEQVTMDLVKSLCDTSNFPHVRNAAASSLSLNANAADLAALRREICNTDGFGCRLASQVFARKGDVEAVSVLESITKSTSDDYVVDGINTAIKSLKYKNQ